MISILPPVSPRACTRFASHLIAGRAGRLGAVILAGALAAAGSAGLAQAQAQVPDAAASAGFVFASPPSAQANRLYSVNTSTGEVSACQFERPEGSLVGVTRCFPRDPSAGPQPKTARFDIFSTHYSGETGVFRVNRDTGEMSVCYVRDMPKGSGTEASVVCTPPAK